MNAPRLACLPEIQVLAASLAPRRGANVTGLSRVRVVRTEQSESDILLFTTPGIVILLQMSGDPQPNYHMAPDDRCDIFVTSVPLPLRIAKRCNPDKTRLAVVVEFDPAILDRLWPMIEARHEKRHICPPRSSVSMEFDTVTEDGLVRLLRALCDPVETAALGAGILGELTYRTLTAPANAGIVEALRPGDGPSWIVRSVNRLYGCILAPVSIPALAGKAGVSVSSFHTHFRHFTGMSPLQYVKAARLHEARRLISEERSRIGDIARAVGYNSPAQFSREFRRYFGHTPVDEFKQVWRS